MVPPITIRDGRYFIYGPPCATEGRWIWNRRPGCTDSDSSQSERVSLPRTPSSRPGSRGAASPAACLTPAGSHRSRTRRTLPPAASPSATALPRVWRRHRRRSTQTVCELRRTERHGGRPHAGRVFNSGMKKNRPSPIKSKYREYRDFLFFIFTF